MYIFHGQYRVHAPNMDPTHTTSTYTQHLSMSAQLQTASDVPKTAVLSQTSQFLTYLKARKAGDGSTSSPVVFTRCLSPTI